MFDLQLFDEEVAENSAETQPAENSQTELPEGFEGLEEFNLDWREIPHFYKWGDESPLFVDSLANIK